ncbi:MAG: potassium channel family protein [Bifidobacteriaceae bacterium]|jgi:voltage-gated potassium channel|nr:potassium channel family protein [Bifidobacteriaceae bacterium]
MAHKKAASLKPKSSNNKHDDKRDSFDDLEFDTTLSVFSNMRSRSTKPVDVNAPKHKNSERFSRYKRKTQAFAIIITVSLFISYAVPICFPEISSEAKSVCYIAFYTSWGLFLVDFLIRFILAARKWEFILANPIDLIAIFIPEVRILRMVRVLTLFTLFSRIIPVSKRSEMTLYTFYWFSMLAILAALDITNAERYAPESNIHTVFDGFYWAVTTITTVGYGNHYPVTFEGKIIAMVLMVSGIIMIGIVARAAVAHFSYKTRRDNLAYLIAHSHEFKDKNIKKKIVQETHKLEEDSDSVD